MDHLDVDLRGILSKALRIESQEIDIHCSAESSQAGTRLLIWISFKRLRQIRAHFSAKEVASMDSVKQFCA